MEEKNIVQRKLTIEKVDDLELTLDCINLHAAYQLVLVDGKFIFTTMSMDDARRDRISDLLNTFGIDHTFEDIPWVSEADNIDISEEDTEDEKVAGTVVEIEDAE